MFSRLEKSNFHNYKEGNQTIKVASGCRLKYCPVNSRIPNRVALCE